MNLFTVIFKNETTLQKHPPSMLPASPVLMIVASDVCELAWVAELS